MQLKKYDNNHFHGPQAVITQKYDGQTYGSKLQIHKQNDNSSFRSKSPSFWCPCEGTCPKCFNKNIINNGISRSTLNISKPNDPLEKEADKIAEQIIGLNYDLSIAKPNNENMSEKKINRKCTKSEEKGEDFVGNQVQINRKNDADNNIKAVVSNKTINDIDTVLSNGGEPLDSQTKELMETRFGYDFSNVRIHNYFDAFQSAQSVNALAYTIGNDIVFGGGQYNPHSIKGRRLIAHELTHVIQTDPNHNNEMRIRSRINYQIMNPQRELNSCHDSHILFRQPERSRPVVKIDAQAASIIEFAKNPENGSEDDRAIETIRLIINTYYADSAVNMPEIVFKEGLKGLEAEVPIKKPGKDFKGKIFVGSEFLLAITEGDYFAHRVLTVGHELQHIDQYKKGMIGEKTTILPLKHEREFLAFYWEAKAPIMTGTGRISPATRRDIIDEALKHFYCLAEPSRKKYNKLRDELRKLREEMNAKAIKFKHPDIPEPTCCKGN